MSQSLNFLYKCFLVNFSGLVDVLYSYHSPSHIYIYQLLQHLQDKRFQTSLYALISAYGICPSLRIKTTRTLLILTHGETGPKELDHQEPGKLTFQSSNRVAFISQKVNVYLKLQFIKHPFCHLVLRPSILKQSE